MTAAALRMATAGLLALWLFGCAPSGKEAGAGANAAPEQGPDEAEPCLVKPPDPPLMCTMDWRPVCGCDGKTRSNACQARAAGVTRFTDGACEEEKVRR
jgi:hypothetical protein